MIISISPPVKAVGEGQWITGYQIEDASSSQLLVVFDSTTGVNMTYSPVLPGAEIKVTITVNVFTPGSGTLKLITGLAKSTSSVYWELVTLGYDLGETYNPASAQAEFSWDQGTFTIILYGKVPATPSNVARTINIVTLRTAPGTILDQITVQATSADLAAFNTLYNQQETKLQSLISSGVAQGYIDIYTNVLNTSRTIANTGDVANAMALLNGLNVSNEPVSSTMELLFLPIVGVLAAVAVVFVVMFLRVRGKVSYFQLVVEDQIKDLEGLTMRVSRIDRTVSSNLESVKDRLKRLVGM